MLPVKGCGTKLVVSSAAQFRLEHCNQLLTAAAAAAM
jgi:hypothetical protein